MSTVDLICSGCGEPFEKAKAEYNRRAKAGHTTFFCSRGCHVRTQDPGRYGRTAAHLDPGNQRDEFTSFRWFLARVRYRAAKKGETDLTLKYLKNLWNRQSGRCPFTGWELVLPRSAGGWDERSVWNASLDRKDCSKGYVKGNVRFVSVMANVARGDFSDADLRGFCRAVTRYE